MGKFTASQMKITEIFFVCVCVANGKYEMLSIKLFRSGGLF